jgi:hypothetical protein
LQDVGGLGTAQRNTAAAMIIATQNFTDPNIFVLITVAKTLGIVMLLAFAPALSKDNPGSFWCDPAAMRADRNVGRRACQPQAHQESDPLAQKVRVKLHTELAQLVQN